MVLVVVIRQISLDGVMPFQASILAPAYSWLASSVD